MTRLPYPSATDLMFTEMLTSTGDLVDCGVLDINRGTIYVTHYCDSDNYSVELVVDDGIRAKEYTEVATTPTELDKIIKKMVRNVRTAMRKAGDTDIYSVAFGKSAVIAACKVKYGFEVRTTPEVVERIAGEDSIGVSEEVKADVEFRIPEPPKVETRGAVGGLEDMLRATILGMATSPDVTDAIESTISKLIKEAGIIPHTKRLEVTTPTLDKVVVDSVHKTFEDLLKLVAAGLNVYLVGPAGSGKSYAAKMVAKTLNLPFYAKSVSALTPVHDFFGYMDANGRFVETDFYHAFRDGGVFLLDEMDNGNPNVLAALNMATSNGTCSFACGMVEKHDNFRVIAAGNTWGFGATTEYVGRNPIDAATLDRFMNLLWDYDEDLERSLAGNDKWVDTIHKLRKAARKKRIKCVISPRASINGAKALAAGLSRKKVLEMTVFNGLESEDRDMLLSAIK